MPLRDSSAFGSDGVWNALEETHADELLDVINCILIESFNIIPYKSIQLQYKTLQTFCFVVIVLCLTKETGRGNINCSRNSHTRDSNI